MSRDARNFRYLNREAVWQGFSRQGLELDSTGRLRLATMPSSAATLPESAADAAGAQGGLAVSPEGSLYVADPDARRVLRREGCFGEWEDITAILSSQTASGLLTPSAVALSERRGLYVADPGTGSVHLYSLPDLVLIDTWTGFGAPACLAVDGDGALYVADPQHGRLHKYLLWGDEAPFAAAAVHAGLVRPTAVAVAGASVFALDEDSGSIFEFDSDGNLLATVAANLTQPHGLAAHAGAVYAGNNQDRRIAVYHKQPGGGYQYAGESSAYSGPVAALVCAGASLWVYEGGSALPVELQAEGGFVTHGLLWSSAIHASDAAVLWHRVRAWADVPAQTEVQFYWYASDNPADPPVDPTAGDPFAAPWNALAPGVTDFSVSNVHEQRLHYICIGARLYGNGDASPTLAQMRVDFDKLTYAQYLPEIYRDKDPAWGDDPDLFFLQRFLSMFASLFEDVEDKIRDLPALVDPDAAPAGALPWLASFFALEPHESLPEARLRETIATAFADAGRRGTVAALEEAIRKEGGVRAVVEEPIRQGSWWQLPGQSACNADGDWTNPGGILLGYNSTLLGSEPEGAIAGVTATIDASHLLDASQYGSALFGELAYRFRILLYRGEAACASTLDRVRAVVDREAPAHTMSEICVIDPGMRIGHKAVLGVDTVLGDGIRTPTRLGEASLVLDGPTAGYIGASAEVGRNTRL